jgi:hypothetical protein
MCTTAGLFRFSAGVLSCLKLSPGQKVRGSFCGCAQIGRRQKKPGRAGQGSRADTIQAAFDQLQTEARRSFDNPTGLPRSLAA